jgi:protein-tyrosine phosphatase
VPVIAHPERNPVLRQKLSRVEEWVEMGCLLQVTAMSIMGSFGGAAKTAGYRLLDLGLVHIVASDAHDLLNRPPRLAEARRAVLEHCGEDAAEILFTDNPRAVVGGVSLPGGKAPWQRPAHWPQFWKRWHRAG